MRKPTAAILLVIATAWLIPASSAPAGRMELVGEPTQIVEDGQLAWEYWYDVYCDVGAPTQLWLHGFDATQLLNIDSGTLYERWDSSAAGYDVFGQLDDYPSYRENRFGPDEWTLNTTDWAMDNPIHLPSEYAGVRNNSMYAGSTSEDGLHFWQAIGNGYRTGLFMTFRLVHPLAPGTLSYSMIGPFYWEQQNAPITGPGGWNPPLGDLDGDGDADAADIDLLCSKLGDPAYDMDGDGDADEDDVTYFIETLVELQDGSGRYGTKRGDFNLDGLVNATDLAKMQSNFGRPGMDYADGNPNCDDVINATDLAIVDTTFGYAAPAGPVPEPITLSLLGLGATIILARRK